MTKNDTGSIKLTKKTIPIFGNSLLSCMYLKRKNSSP